MRRPPPGPKARLGQELRQPSSRGAEGRGEAGQRLWDDLVCVWSWAQPTTRTHVSMSHLEMIRLLLREYGCKVLH